MNKTSTYEQLSQRLHDYESRGGVLTQRQDASWEGAEQWYQAGHEDIAIKFIQPVIKELGL